MEHVRSGSADREKPSAARRLHAVAASPAVCEHCEAAAAAATGVEPPAVSRVLPADFVRQLAAMPGEIVFPLPDGREFHGMIDIRVPGPDGETDTISGRVTQPGAGRFSFTRERDPGFAFPLSGRVEILACDTAYRVEIREGEAHLAAVPAQAVVCRGLPQAANGEIAEMPSEHPTNIPIPNYQNGVIPLQSLPGAQAVVYLDFDGEDGPHIGWGNFDAQSYNFGNTMIKAIWIRVAEDFTPFNINITTDLAVFQAATGNRRQRVIITPTNDASPGAGGVAFLGSFNGSADIPCWVYNQSNAKVVAETISHEVGHTLTLEHDGRNTPSEEYYFGHGSGVTGWGPIMGAAYDVNISQWSKGEYASASQKEDDLALIVDSNNSVDYRADDGGDTLANARYLEIQGAGNTVSGQGIIGTNTDKDTFRFRTSDTGTTNLTVKPVTDGPNLDILAEIIDGSGTVLASGNPAGAIEATVSASLPAGEYALRISGSGSTSGQGYSSYASMGAYSLSGTVANAVKADRFTLVETTPAGSVVGSVNPLLAHGGNPLQFTFVSGNAGGAFALDASTGQLTVASAAAINFETLSTTWETPAWFEMFVNVQDLADPELNEVRRVVVIVTNVNEGPIASGGGSFAIPQGLAVGATVATITATDPDRFDRVNAYTILSGNTGGAFAISATGVVTCAVPAALVAGNTFNLVVGVRDSGFPAITTSVTVDLNVVATPDGLEPGAARRAIYDGIAGTDLTSLTTNPRFPASPDREILLTQFADSGRGTNFGSSTRALLIVPHTATYTFWIGGDDTCELWFSADGVASHATVIASSSTSMPQFQWDNTPSQKSVDIPLSAGQICYIEVRQKQGGGSENFSVAWRALDGENTLITRQVISGTYLSPQVINYSPRIVPGTINLFKHAAPGSVVGFAKATDFNEGQTFTYAITGGNGANIFAIRASDGRISVPFPSLIDPAVSYQIEVTATDNGSPQLSGSGMLGVTFRAPGPVLAALQVVTSPVGSAATTGSGLFGLGQQVPISTVPGGIPFKKWSGSGIGDSLSASTNVVLDTVPVGLAGSGFPGMSATNQSSLSLVPGSNDIAWSLLGTGQDMDIVDDSAGIGSGEALRIDGSSTANRGLLGTWGSTVTPEIGETLSVTIDGRYYESPAVTANGLFVGFTSSSAKDQTVSARFGTGGNAGTTMIRDLPNDSSPGTGQFGIMSSTSSGPAAATISTQPFTIVLSIHRLNATQSVFSAAIGNSVQTSAPVSLAWSSYNSFFIRNGSIGADFMIDNVVVSRCGVKTVAASFGFPLSYPTWISGFPLEGDDAQMNADPDGDGFSNFTEMHLGFDPTDALSRLSLYISGVDSNTTYLGVNRLVTSGNFTLQSSSNLAGPWDSKPITVLEDAIYVPLPFATNGTRRFFRINYLPPAQ